MPCGGDKTCPLDAVFFVEVELVIEQSDGNAFPFCGEKIIDLRVGFFQRVARVEDLIGQIVCAAALVRDVDQFGSGFL